MKCILLRDKRSHKLFGAQCVIGVYTFQVANWKFGVFNGSTYKWLGE